MDDSPVKAPGSNIAIGSEDLTAYTAYTTGPGPRPPPPRRAVAQDASGAAGMADSDLPRTM